MNVSHPLQHGLMGSKLSQVDQKLVTARTQQTCEFRSDIDKAPIRMHHRGMKHIEVVLNNAMSALNFVIVRETKFRNKRITKYTKGAVYVEIVQAPKHGFIILEKSFDLRFLNDNGAEVSITFRFLVGTPLSPVKYQTILLRGRLSY